jgi:hypothetical protein
MECRTDPVGPRDEQDTAKKAVLGEDGLDPPQAPGQPTYATLS